MPYETCISYTYGIFYNNYTKLALQPAPIAMRTESALPLRRSPGAALASTLAAAMPGTMGRSGNRRATAAVIVACASLALVCSAMILSAAPEPISLKAKEDLSMFADSSVSFYEPGDTAADSDILPRAVLAEDGSPSDAAESTQLHEAANYADAHWYKAGQSQDVHGDLQEENRAREHTERVKMVHQQQLHEQEHEMWAKRQQQRAIEAEQAQLRQRRRAAVQELHDRRMARAHEEQRGARGRSAMPLSYKAMQSHMHAKDAAIHKSILRDSYAYQHPFSSDKKGMQNLVMAEFKQDEHKMKATTDAIFGSKKAHNHQWRHGGLLLSDASHPDTLHDAMRRQRAQRKVEDKARAEQLAEEHPGMARAGADKKAYKPHVVSVGCTIEQLENGGCSHHAKRVKASQASSTNQKSVAKAAGATADVVEPSAAPTAGTVISGWASSVGGWF